jgi:hypothetical protein
MLWGASRLQRIFDGAQVHARAVGDFVENMFQICGKSERFE